MRKTSTGGLMQPPTWRIHYEIEVTSTRNINQS